jgi:hypothetical protein
MDAFLETIADANRNKAGQFAGFVRHRRVAFGKRPGLGSIDRIAF